MLQRNYFIFVFFFYWGCAQSSLLFIGFTSYTYWVAAYVIHELITIKHLYVTERKKINLVRENRGTLLMLRNFYLEFFIEQRTELISLVFNDLECVHSRPATVMETISKPTKTNSTKYCNISIPYKWQRIFQHSSFDLGSLQKKKQWNWTMSCGDYLSDFPFDKVLQYNILIGERERERSIVFLSSN